MAKSSSFFGLRKGSTKAHTFSVYRGEQVTKDRVTDITNPQTSKQMERRVKMPLVAATRSALAGIVDHSFEGVEYGYKSKVEFSRRNLEYLNVLSYGSKGIRTSGIANYLVSSGRITPLETINQGEENFSFALNISDKSEKRPTNLNDVIDMILAGSPDLKEGDQLTFLTACALKDSGQQYESATAKYKVITPQWEVHRMVLKHGDPINAEIQFSNTAENTYAIKWGTGLLTLIIGYPHSSEGKFYPQMMLDKSAPKARILMLTIITSRYDEASKTWLRSTNRMTCNEKFTTKNENKNVASKAMAIDSYLKGATLSSDYYLNEGGNATA